MGNSYLQNGMQKAEKGLILQTGGFYNRCFQSGGLIMAGLSVFIIITIMRTKSVLRKISSSRRQIENFISNPTAEKAIDINDFIRV